MREKINGTVIILGIVACIGIVLPIGLVEFTRSSNISNYEYNNPENHTFYIYARISDMDARNPTGYTVDGYFQIILRENNTIYSETLNFNFNNVFVNETISNRISYNSNFYHKSILFLNTFIRRDVIYYPFEATFIMFRLYNTNNINISSLNQIAYVIEYDIPGYNPKLEIKHESNVIEFKSRLIRNSITKFDIFAIPFLLCALLLIDSYFEPNIDELMEQHKKKETDALKEKKLKELISSKADKSKWYLGLVLAQLIFSKPELYKLNMGTSFSLIVIFSTFLFYISSDSNRYYQPFFQLLNKSIGLIILPSLLSVVLLFLFPLSQISLIIILYIIGIIIFILILTFRNEISNLFGINEL